jgi:hypothetical protein
MILCLNAIGTYTSNDTQTSGVGNGSGQLGTGGDVHTRQQDWVLDLQEIGGGGSQLLRRRHVDLTGDRWCERGVAKRRSECEKRTGIPRKDGASKARIYGRRRNRHRTVIRKIRGERSMRERVRRRLSVSA